MKPTKSRYRYFFLDGKLHKLLAIRRYEDTCITWSNSEKRKYLYQWSFVKKNADRAISAREIAKFMNVTKRSIWNWVDKGLLAQPEVTIPIMGDPDRERIPGHGGGRKEAFWTPDQVEEMLMLMDASPWYKNRVPSKREFQAFKKYDMMLYAKTSDGEFVPVWEAEDW